MANVNIYSKKEVLDAALQNPKAAACAVVENMDSFIVARGERVTKEDLKNLNPVTSEKDYRAMCKASREAGIEPTKPTIWESIKDFLVGKKALDKAVGK